MARFDAPITPRERSHLPACWQQTIFRHHRDTNAWSYSVVTHDTVMACLRLTVSGQIELHNGKREGQQIRHITSLPLDSPLWGADFVSRLVK